MDLISEPGVIASPLCDLPDQDAVQGPLQGPFPGLFPAQDNRVGPAPRAGLEGLAAQGSVKAAWRPTHHRTLPITELHPITVSHDNLLSASCLLNSTVHTFPYSAAQHSAAQHRTAQVVWRAHSVPLVCSLVRPGVPWVCPWCLPWSARPPLWCHLAYAYCCLRLLLPGLRLLLPRSPIIAASWHGCSCSMRPRSQSPALAGPHCGSRRPNDCGSRRPNGALAGPGGHAASNNTAAAARPRA